MTERLLFEYIFFQKITRLEWETVTNFHELKYIVTPDNVNSLALLDLNSLTDAKWSFSGNNQTASQMRCYECFASFLISVNISRTEELTRCLPAI